jgi:hypothetical protein
MNPDVERAFRGLERALRRLAAALRPASVPDAPGEPPTITPNGTTHHKPPPERVRPFDAWPRWGVVHVMECDRRGCITCLRLQLTAPPSDVVREKVS